MAFTFFLLSTIITLLIIHFLMAISPDDIAMHAGVLFQLCMQKLMAAGASSQMEEVVSCNSKPRQQSPAANETRTTVERKPCTASPRQWDQMPAVPLNQDQVLLL